MARIKIDTDLVDPLQKALDEIGWMKADGIDIESVDITLYERGSKPCKKFRVVPHITPIEFELQDEDNEES